MDLLNLEELKAELMEPVARQRCGAVSAADSGAITVTGLGPRARLGDGIAVRQRDGGEAEGEIIALDDGGARAGFIVKLIYQVDAA